MSSPAAVGAALTPAECWARIRTAAVSRLAFTERALPAIRPTALLVIEESVLIWGVVGGSLTKLDGQVVGVAIDDVHSDAGEGWAVEIVGRAELVPIDVARLSGHAPVPLRRQCVLRVRAERISGRRWVCHPSGSHRGDVK